MHMKFGLWIIAVINTARDLGSVKTKCSQPDGSGKMYIVQCMQCTCSKTTHSPLQWAVQLE